MVGVGTDTGGSIRIPAALCGTVGLKPTYGRSSKRGIAPLSWSLDHVGPLARNVGDCALVLNAIAGPDPLDPSTLQAPVPDHTADLDRGIEGLRVGVPVNHFFDAVSDDVAAAVRRAATVLEGLGARLQEVVIPLADAMMAAGWAIILPEASSYHQEALRERADLFGPDVRLFLESGELVLATDYIRALRVRTLVQQAWAEMFQDIDVLIAPTVPVAAPTVGTMTIPWPGGAAEDITQALVRLTLPSNLTGLPSLSLPAGFDADGLPLGMQVVGRPLDEATVLRVGKAYEDASDTVGRLAPL
jgi:aspartyl-tRNA(Asn)/glutamyl-tRNA(Gln) amidotransferase subunit A